MDFFLAFFILPVATLHSPTPSVDLAQVQQAKSEPGALRVDALMVAFTRDDNLFMGNYKVTLGSHMVAGEELVSPLEIGIHEASEHRLYLQGDARARYGHVKRVLDVIRAAGIELIVLLTERVRPR